MQKTYEAIYNGGVLTWVRDRPCVQENHRVFVVVESEPPRPSARDQAFDEARGAWGAGKSLDEVDRELETQRNMDWARMP